MHPYLQVIGIFTKSLTHSLFEFFFVQSFTCNQISHSAYERVLTLRNLSAVQLYILLNLIDSIAYYLDDNVALPLLEALTLDYSYIIL